MAKVRLNIEISQQLADFLDSLAECEHTTRSEMVRRAISVLQAFQQQRKIGRPHLGFVKDPRRLDAEIIGVLQPLAPDQATVSHAPREARPDPIAPAALLKPAPSERGPVSMDAAMSRWSPHVGRAE